VLEGHASYVKGIAWDPVGTYLASQVRLYNLGGYDCVLPTYDSGSSGFQFISLWTSSA